MGYFADMDDAVDTSYQPPAGFVEDKKDALVDFELTDSTELWLIQWPINQVWSCMYMLCQCLLKDAKFFSRVKCDLFQFYLLFLDHI